MTLRINCPNSLESQSTARLAKATDMRAEDIENQLRRNNIHMVGLPEKVEDRDPTEFVERWLVEIFFKEAFTSVCYGNGS